MYKQASKLKLRFQTSKGSLSVEQLWGLSQTDLSSAIKDVKKVLTKDDDNELSFLDDTKVTDVENHLRFEILKDVYLTKKRETEDARIATENKAFNQKILGIIADKQEEGLRSKSISELRDLLK